MRYSAAILLSSLLLLASCGKEKHEQDADGRTTVRFRCGDLAESGTRAVDLPEGRTVRVVVYDSESGATGPDLAGRAYITSNTYEVLSDGTLAPCAVNAKGEKTASGGFDLQVPVFDSDVRHLDFYAYSPALPLDAGEQTVTVTNGVDFIATALYGMPITYSNTGHIVSFDPMSHLCSAIRFEYIYNTDGVTLGMQTGNEYLTNRKLGFNIDNLYLAGTFTLGGSSIQLPSNDATGLYAADNGTLFNPYVSQTLYANRLYGEVYLLPGAAHNTKANDRITFALDMSFETSSGSNLARVSSFPASDAALLLVKGQRTTFNMLVNYIGPGTIDFVFTSSKTSAIDQWLPGGETTFEE